MLRKFIKESNEIEGIFRDPRQPEIAAYEKFLALETITVQDLEELVLWITCGAVHSATLRREQGQDVRVGNHYPILGGHQVEVQLNELLSQMPLIGNYQTHLEYESLHPFTDGNGRSGRALWLWQNKTIPAIGFLQSFYYQTLQNQ